MDSICCTNQESSIVFACTIFKAIQNNSFFRFFDLEILSVESIIIQREQKACCRAFFLIKVAQAAYYICDIIVLRDMYGCGSLQEVYMRLESS
jgi:hypothetical protein